MINTDTALATWLDKIAAAPIVGLDTEADSLYSYPERLCLIQIALPNDLLLIDPLADLDLTPFWQSLEGKELIIHAADYDLRLLCRHFQFVPASIFDTMWAARFLGFREFGLFHLVNHFHGVELEKGSQKADWGQRPLTEKMSDYALNDVRYLLSLRDSLHALLEEQGRRDWLDEQGRRLIDDAVKGVNADTSDAWRIKGSSRLDPRGLAFLRALWKWREGEACRVNKPPYFVLKHDALIQLAVAAGAGNFWQSLLPLRFSNRRRREVGDVIRATGALDDADWPEVKRTRKVVMSETEKQRIEELKTLRDARADKLGLDPTLIASKATLVSLARDWEGQLSQMMRWQRRLLEG